MEQVAAKCNISGEREPIQEPARQAQVQKDDDAILSVPTIWIDPWGGHQIDSV